MKIRSGLFSAAIVIGCATATLKAAPPVSDATGTSSTKPLALDAHNSHYFLWRDKPTLLVSSGEHYGAVLNHEFDYVAYLDELKSCGLNHTRLWTGTYHEIPGAFNIADNTLAPKPARYITPWPRSKTGGAADGENKFDLSHFNPAYFDRLEDFLSQASKRGIVVEVNLFCPNYDDGLWNVSPMNAKNNVNGVGQCGRDDVYTLKHPDLLKIQQAVTREIVKACQGFDNLYFEVCNEPYFGGVTVDWQKQIIATIVETEKDQRARHLISMNIANGHKKIENPPPEVSIFNFHYASPPDAVAENFALNKVIGENETGFKGSEDVTYRREGWAFILAGGGLYDSLDYSFTVSHPDGSLTGYKAPGGGSHALRLQLGALRRFMEGFDFVDMAPDNSAIAAGLGKNMSAHVLAQPGKQYGIYIAGGDHAELQLNLPKGEYVAQWWSPVEGKIVKTQALASDGGKTAIASPAYNEDIALAIKRK